MYTAGDGMSMDSLAMVTLSALTHQPECTFITTLISQTLNVPIGIHYFGEKYDNQQVENIRIETWILTLI